MRFPAVAGRLIPAGLIWALAMGMTLLPARGARADEPGSETSVCVVAFERGQALRREGALREARDQLLLCAQASCPELLSERCLPWLEEVRAAIPTVIVAAKDAAGRDVFDARIVVDGEVVAERLDGRPLELDPGPRRIRVERPGMIPVERDVVIVEGEQRRRLDVVLEPPGEPEPAPEPAPPAEVVAEDGPSGALIASYSLVALGTAALVAGSITGGLSIQRATDLRYLCGGTHCPPEYEPAYEEGLALAHAATTCFVVGGAAFAAAITAWAFDDGATIAPVVTPGGLGMRGAF
jgi:hypothetical protein